MPNPVWPAALPQFVLVPGYSEGPGDNVVHSQPDSGPPITRRRYTAVHRPLDCAVPMTAAELATFETFFKTDLKDGSLPFDWVHPRSQQAASFKFREDSYSAAPEAGGNTWLVTMHLWILP